MKRSLILSLIGLILLAACSPAAAPATTSAQPPPPAAVQPPGPAAAPATSSAPEANLPDLRPPVSGGLNNPPTLSPQIPNTQPNTVKPVKGWQELKASIVPPARYDHALVFASDFNRLVLFGGRSANALNDTWVYDLSTNAWHSITSTPAPDARFGLGAAYDAVRQRVLIFGGQSSKFFNDVWAFDLKTEKWSKLNITGAEPQMRYGTSAVIDPTADRLIVSHGFTDQGRFDDTWSLDLKTNKWQDVSPKDRPLKRCLHDAAFDVKNRKMILFGGCSSGFGPCPQGDLWSFDPTAKTWTEIKPIGAAPDPRSNYSMVYNSVDGRMLMYGGKTSKGVNNELWSLDSTGKWTSISFSGGPPARSNHDGAWDSINKRLMVFGGQDAKGNALNDLWAYTP
jgi:hypothetical protein